MSELASDTAYRFSFELHDKRVRAVWGDLTIADSARVMVLRETRMPPVFYFPRADVRMDLLRRTEYVSHCPFKGNATHFSLHAPGGVAENMAWSYEETLDGAHQIAGYVAFYSDQISAWFEDDVRLRAAPASDDGDRINPLAAWVMNEAPQILTAKELTGMLARRMREMAIPLYWLRVIIPDLHPQVAAYAYRWSSRTGEVEEFLAGHETLESQEYLESPLVPIFQGAGGIRRRLDIADPLLDYEVLRDLHAEGATDYVAMPMVFSDGQINVVTLASDRPGGFSTTDLGQIYEVLAMLARLYEVHALKRKSRTLLDTYVGSHAGERVLSGRIKRGDGESIYSVIWFCDLRESTPLAQALGHERFLACLNDFFDCTAGAVMAHGGQVLRFIGDAALAIFPIEDDSDPDHVCAAYHSALEAVTEARKRFAEINATRSDDGEPTINFGIALHVGEVVYGNIGTESRLEFTVIGEAANRAARIESMCKTLGEPVLLSGEFAQHFPGRFRSLGRHGLRGVADDQEIFALEEKNS